MPKRTSPWYQFSLRSLLFWQASWQLGVVLGIAVLIGGVLGGFTVRPRS
jgi:uncharacterized integral membrane protein